MIKQAFFIDLDKQKIIDKQSKQELITKLKNYENEKGLFDKKDLFWMYSNAILNKSLDEAKALDNSIVVIDPTVELYSKEKENYFQQDGLHLNDNGNKIISLKIFESLVNEKLIKN